MRTGSGSATRPDWWPTALAISALIAVTLFVYRDTVAGLITLWGQSETFAHGYLVPFISAWLVWRQRNALSAVSPTISPAPLTLLIVLAVAGLWLAGDLAGVNPATQFALVSFIVLTVPALAGWPATRVILFPLAFLFFAVPFGEFLLPWLMARTADFTVLALRASGIPVYRDGLQFVIPSGTWSVVEACSGVRYLIASLMVGALFAYLNYRSTQRRILFMFVALVVPIVANWMRAYMIVMIGHLSSNTLAVGVDHLIYGWLFFGVVVGVMFLVGSRWSEAPADAAPAVDRGSNVARPAGPVWMWGTAIAMLCLLILPQFVLRALDAGEGRSALQLAAPYAQGMAGVGGAGLPSWTPAYANPSASVERQYLVSGKPMGLFIAYYRGQGPGSKLVSSANALVRSNDPLWVVADSGSRNVNLADRQLVVKTASLRRPVASSDTTRLAVRQVYWVNGRFEASDVRAKAWGAWYRLLGRGDDGAVVIVYTTELHPGDADQDLDLMLRNHLPAVAELLRRTRDGE